MKRKEAILVISPLVAGFLVFFMPHQNTAYYQWIPFKENLILTAYILWRMKDESFF